MPAARLSGVPLCVTGMTVSAVALRSLTMEGMR